MASKDDDFYKQTFSQREGKAPLPEPMRLEHIPQKFRQLVWGFIDKEIAASRWLSPGEFGRGSSQWRDRSRNLGIIIRAYKFNILGMLHDEIGRCDPEDSLIFFKQVITEGKYHEILALIEFVLRHELCSETLRKNLVSAFDDTPIAYFVEEINGVPTIMPRVSREAGEGTQQAVQSISAGGFEGAATHLRQAAEQINTGQYAKSIVDSIHAVESVAREIAPKESKTLGPALNSLSEAGLLHPALKEGFKKIYGYTNDEQGIRHPLVDRDSPDVGLDEAMFMFGACASFTAYLVSKHRKMQGGSATG